MANLCEIRSLSIYRNCNYTTLYFVASKIGEKEEFSARISVDTLPSFILDQYIYFSFGSKIGTSTVNNRAGNQFVRVEIDRYQLTYIADYERTTTAKDIKCGNIAQE